MSDYVQMLYDAIGQNDDLKAAIAITKLGQLGQLDDGTHPHESYGALVYMPPIVMVAYSSKSDLLRMVLKHSINVNALNEDGGTALHAANRVGNTESVKLLLEAGANPNLADCDGETVLMQACRWNQLGSLKLLLEAKADTNMQSSAGYTALMFASRDDRPQCVKLLLNAGANPSIRLASSGKTALDIATTLEHISCIRLLKANIMQGEC